MTTFFVSYNKADRQWAEWIAWQLEDARNGVFIQAWDIRPGSNFVLAMQDGITKADRTVAVLSPDYVKSKFTQPEWSAAFAQDPTGERGLLIPVRVREVDLRGIWVAIVYIDLVGLTQEEAKKALLEGINRGRAKPALIPSFPGEIIHPEPTVHPRPIYPTSESIVRDRFINWSVLDAVTTKDGGLSFLFRPESTRLTELNAVELNAKTRNLVEHFLDQVENSLMSSDVLATLFELLIPNRIRTSLAKSTRLRLLVDENTARYPWELLCDPSQAPTEPNFALRSGLIRCFSFREVQAVATKEIPPPSALVVGDPMITGFPALPGAHAESQAVSRIFKDQDFEVRLLIGASALEILNALFSYPYRFVHIAARASYAHGRVGLVLSDGILLTPMELEMMEILPDLVFINFGHLDSVQTNFSDETESRSLGLIAAALAAGFIRQGVRALIVSGSAVEDAACVTFVSTLYRALLAGETFGVAIHKARLLTHESHIGVTTWGAFHCYGDPDFRIVEPRRDDKDRTPTNPQHLTRS